MPDGLYGTPQPDLDALDQGADVPISPGDAYGAQFRDNAFDMTRRVVNFVGDHTVRAGAPQLSPDEANQKYGIEGQLRFNTPVTDNDAAFRHAETLRTGYDAILNSRSGANPLMSMGASLAGSMVDPLGLGLMAATDGIAGVVRGGMAVNTAVDASTVAARSGLFANTARGALSLGRTAAEGAALNLPFVGADAYLRHDVGDDMSMGEALQDLAVGAVFHTGMHYAGEALGRFAGRDTSTLSSAPSDEAADINTASGPAWTPDPVADLPAQASNAAWLKSVDDLNGDESVDVARHVENARNPDSLAGLDEVSADPTIPGRWLSDDTAVTPRGTDVPVRYGLVEMGNLSTSHDDNLNVNPDYPAELQPRDRGRVGAMARNYQLEQELNPRLLMSDVSAAGGAPIIAPDGTVESGNGRTIALRRSAMQGRSDAYPRYVAALNEAGYDTTGMKQPMLVRARSEPLSGAMRANLAREMNADVTERMSATEQAMADGQRISDDDLAQPMDTGADQRSFHRAFLARVAPDQINQLVGTDGAMSPEGVRRVNGALVARAYGDPRTVAALSDPATETAFGLSQGLASAAPDWARMRAMAARGDIPPDVDLTPNLNGAMDLVRQAKAAGMGLERFLAERLGQGDMFSGDAIAPETEAFLRLLYKDEAFKKPREPGRIAWALREYARQATEVTPGPDLFGAAADVTTARKIIENVNQRFATGDAGRIDLRAPGKAADADAGGAQSEARAPVIDLRQPGGDGPDDGGGGLRQDGGEQAPGGGDKPDADLQPAQGRPGAGAAGRAPAARLGDIQRATAEASGAPFFDKHHADLYDLGVKARDEASSADLQPEAERLSAALSTHMDWSDEDLDPADRDALADDKPISAARMLQAARDYADDVDADGGPEQAGGMSMYDPERLSDVVQGRPVSAQGMGDSIIAADPELKALADDTARLAAESGVAEDPTPDNQNPDNIAAAVRAAGQCLFEAAGEVLG